MKKNKLYTVNRPVFMPSKNLYGFGGGQDDSFDNAFITGISPTVSRPFGSWNTVSSSKIGPQVSRAGVPGVPGLNTNIDFDALNGLKQNIKTPSKLGLQLKNFAGSQLGGAAIGLAGSLVGQGLNSAISNGLSSGVGNTVSSLGSTIGGAVGAVNPLLGGIISAGSGLLGGLANAAFGSKMNQNNIADIEGNIADMRSLRLNGATSNNDLLNKWGSVDLGYNFDKSYIGKDGWFSNKAGKKFRNLQNQQNAAREYAKHQLMTAANQADRYQDDLAQSTFVYSNGGGIHIDPSKKGTFTAAASKHGMGVQEFASKVLANKEDYSPTMVKKANFAKNAAKWHDYGGPLNYLNTGALGIMQNDKYLDAINHRSDVLAKNAMAQYSSYTPGTYAFGGELGTNGTDWTNGLLYVDAGGTHQQNPLGGVPVGFDQNGTPNLVEEGETIWNDYVFSNRIKVPKAMFHTLGLGGAMKKNRLTFADASKKLAKESEQRPNDPISMAGLEASLSKLAAVQEAERMKKQMRESVGLENMAAYGGPVNRFEDGGALDWLNKHYPELQNKEIIAKAIENHVKKFNSSKAIDSIKYGNALKDIQKGYGNYKNPTTEYLRGNSKRNEKHFNSLKELGIPEDIAFDIAFPSPEQNISNTASYLYGVNPNEVYTKQLDTREGIRSMLVPEKINTTNDTVTEGINQEVENENPGSMMAQAALSTNPELEWGIQNAMQEAARQEAERNYLAGLTPSERNTFNSMPLSQRQEVLRQVSQGITAGNTSSGTEYPVTSGVRSNRNTGFTRDMAFVSSLDDMFNGTYGFTPSNGAQYIPYTGMSEAEVREIENDPRFQSWTKRVNDNFYNEKDVEVQNYLRQLDKAAGGNHLFDANGNLRSDAKDYYNRARTQNHLMGWYHLTPLFEKAAQAANTQASGEPQIMSAEEEEKAKLDAAKQPSSNLPQPKGANGETNPGVDLSGRTSPIDEKRPLLPTWMRYAPVFGGAAGVLGDMLGLTNKPDYTYADRLEAAANAAGYAPSISPQPIGDYIRYNPFDRLFYANQLQANARATDRALANTSSPSRAAGLLANAYNTTNSLGNLYRQGEEYNLAQRQQTADFNRRTNMFNSQMGLEAAMANARYRQMAKNYQMEGLGRAAALRDSIDQRVGAARSANLTNFFNSLGNIGRENFTFNQINQDPTRSYIYQTPINGGWGYLPKFMQDAYQKDVESAAQRMMEEERKKNAEAQKTTQSASGAYGGKLKRNKK